MAFCILLMIFVIYAAKKSDEVKRDDVAQFDKKHLQIKDISDTSSCSKKVLMQRTFFVFHVFYSLVLFLFDENTEIFLFLFFSRRPKRPVSLI